MSAAPTSSTQGGGGNDQAFAPAQIVDQEQIVTFIDEGVTESETLPIPRPDRGFLAPAKDSLVNSVIGFLERPREWQNFAWPSTSPRGGLLTYVNLPRDWLTANAVREKLSGFRYLRCNFHIKIQVNAQQMNAGRLFMVWQPFWMQMANKPASALTISGLTGYPLRVDLDLADATAFEMVVPYVGNTSHYDLIQGMGTSGQVQVYTYSALTGLSEVDATMWLWASDIDIQLPTGLPVQTVSPLTGLHKSHRGPIQADWATPDGSDPTGSFREFASMRPEPSGQRRLDAEKKPGIISRILDIGGKMAMAASGIPKIGIFALAGGAIARGLGKLASAFGWSKPINDQITTQVRPLYLKSMANFNGNFDGKTMALDTDNQVDIPTFIYGSDVDEMSFAHILRRPVYMDAFTFSDTHVPNDNLWSWPVDPMSCKKVVSTMVAAPSGYQTGCQSNNTYMSYVGNFFSLWRGSICYKFKVVKTSFHSGRVKVIYVPGATPDTDLNTVDQSKVYTKVVDLRTDNYFEICVPYNWYTPFKEISKKQSESANVQDLTGVPMGMLYVIVVNSLRNPSTVASHIEFIVETNAGEDFQYAMPGVTHKVWPLIDQQDTMTELSSARGYHHSGDIQGDMFENPTTSDEGVNALGYGEIIFSWRQILKRYSYLPSATVVAGTDCSSYVEIPTRSIANPADATIRLGELYDSLRWVASLFRFQSGPMRLSCLANQATNACNNSYLMLPAEQYLNPDTNVKTEFSVYTPGWSKTVQAGTTEPVVELEIPFYQPYPCILTDLGRPTQLSTEEIFLPTSNFTCTPTNTGTVLRFVGVSDNFANTQWYRSIGERFSFGMLLGPPPTISFAPNPP